jgi:hypothetical protein
MCCGRGAGGWSLRGLRAGMCVGRGVVDRFDNNGEGDAKALCAVTPAAGPPQT